MDKVKLIAFYLPQFHSIPENDKWWGEGFTEWTNTRKAKALFPKHYQPREPYNENYINLLDPEARNWQANIAREYGIYGFCYYHYWFKGKKLLQKPLEEVLQTGKPDFPFCIAWANEPWTRTWYGNEKEVLMPQDYGNEKDWEEHFLYLLEAFRDPRYVRVDNKPVFMIYRSFAFDRCREMIDLWNDLARKNGLEGIYFVRMMNGFRLDPSSAGFDAQVEYEPAYTITFDMPFLFRCFRKIRKYFRQVSLKTGIGKGLFLDRIGYGRIWSRILRRKPSGILTFPGAFVDWDNSARRSYRGIMMKGTSPERFERYLKKQIQRAQQVYHTDYIFINAWNEWGEGNYLEPDQRFGYGYLEAVKKAVSEI